jgi:hypothetical protein
MNTPAVLSRMIADAYGQVPMVSLARPARPFVVRPRRLPASEVAELRQYALESCPPFEDVHLDRFLVQVFAVDEVVESYFCPKMLRFLRGQARIEAEVLVPFAEASCAATHAHRSTLLPEHERDLAFVAALLLPCGLFHSQHPAFKPSGRNFNPGRDYWRRSAELLIGPALKVLRTRDRSMAQTLAEVLGFEQRQDCDVHQVARIVTVTCMANMRLTHLWGRS